MSTLKRIAFHAAAMTLAVMFSQSPALAAATTCLTGTAAEVSGDAVRIRALQLLIDEQCPCGSFDGSPGADHRGYTACAAEVLSSEIDRGNLRAKCKATVKGLYAKSTCGGNPLLHLAPCLSTSVASGKVKCTIKATTKSDGVTATNGCTSTDSTSKASCTHYDTCIAAADTDHNLLINGDDGGECVALPTASPTSTPTSTPTLTFTPTSTPTSTPTLTFTPTSTPTATPTNTSSPTATPTSTPTATAVPVCGNGLVEVGEQCDNGALNGVPNSCCTGICGAVAANTLCSDDNSCTQNDRCSGAGVCTGSLVPLGPPVITEIIWEDTPAILDGLTSIPAAGSLDDTAQAHVFDPSRCYNPSAPPPTYHWVVITPLTGSGYTARGISGYRSDTLFIRGDSIPNFAPNSIAFTFTATTAAGSTTKTFRVVYEGSALTLQMSTTCQTMQVTGFGCDIDAALAVLPGTLT